MSEESEDKEDSEEQGQQKTFILSTLKRGRVGTPLMRLSVCPSVTTERLSKL